MIQFQSGSFNAHLACTSNPQQVAFKMCSHRPLRSPFSTVFVENVHIFIRRNFPGDDNHRISFW